MSSIEHFNLRTFDLNLLVAFDALMEEGSVTRAASRLRVQQPAMSHSLATLRMLLQDELFVRTGQKMQPTARARALAPSIRDVLHQVQETLRHKERFDPCTEDRTFRLGFSSELELLVLPELTARLRQHAPGIRLLGHTTTRAEVHQMLDEGELDLAIGCFDHDASRHVGIHLFEQSMSCCFNPRLLPLSSPVSVKDYVNTGHALMTLKDDLHGCLSKALERIDTKLNVVMAAAEFLTVLTVAAQVPVLATLPTRMAKQHAPRFGLEVSPVPLELRVPAVSMVWSMRLDQEPGTEWLRARVRSILSEYTASGPKR